ncbi:uncharacterized protein BX664DRAFT_321914 [Halteromyces radiatus]|uniref:uncharacterized protein n=1 Tax=Halteromyces radiatus TaxID=101107 RepID=UPI00221F8772|nr:uncharacterized protein BX664DRAFT_321914 [Halteromyces radiatus]KAI8099706.1 hypothetical protein BX664DRAFT_321914 [Halteromyces radiatus]
MPIPESPSSLKSPHEDWYSSPTFTSGQQGRDMTLSELSITKLYRVELKAYLTSFLEKETIHGAAPKRVASRQKLSKLNAGQFLELARDVYDEMIRRTKHEKEVPFLPVHDEFHPRRNQARQKLATLPVHRFMDLASDVYHELSRRYPHTKMEKNDALPPLPLPVDNTNENTHEWFPQTVIPEKSMAHISTISGGLEQSQQEYHAYSQHPFETEQHNNNTHHQDSLHTDWTDSLDSLIADIDSMVRPHSQFKDQLSSGTKDIMTTSRRPSHRMEIEELQQSHEHKVNCLNQRIQDLEQVEFDLRTRNDQLEKQNQQLVLQHQQQEETVHKVKKEILELLNQLDTLSNKNEQIIADRDRAYDLVEELKDQTKEWQSKYSAVTRQLHASKGKSSSSISTKTLSWNYQQDVLGPIQSSPHGIISYDTIINYQTCIEDLIQKSRSSQPADILPCMKSIVMVCKAISDQVDQSQIASQGKRHGKDKGIKNDSKKMNKDDSDSDSNTEESNIESEDDDHPSSTKKIKDQLHIIRRQYALALHHLLAASKGYVHGSGLYPLCLLDTSAGHLTNVVIELVQLLGISD